MVADRASATRTAPCVPALTGSNTISFHPDDVFQLRLYLGVLIALLATLGAMFFLSAIAALFVVRGKRGIPRKLCLVAVLGGAFGGLEDRPGPASSVFVALVNSIGGGATPALLLRLFTLPFSNKFKSNKTQHWWLKFLAIFAFFIPLINVVTYSNCGGPHRRTRPVCDLQPGDFYSTVLRGGLRAVMGDYELALLNDLIKALDASIKLNSNGASGFAGTFKKRVNFIRNIFTALCLAIVPMGSVLELLYFVIDVHPYRFVMWFIFNASSPLNNVGVLWFSSMGASNASEIKNTPITTGNTSTKDKKATNLAVSSRNGQNTAFSNDPGGSTIQD
jgi:hypothetical protein